MLMLTFSTLLTATNTGAAVWILPDRFVPGHNICRGDPTTRSTKEVSIQLVWSHDIRTAPEKDCATLAFNEHTANS
jgi:hypothetical protein